MRFIYLNQWFLIIFVGYLTTIFVIILSRKKKSFNDNNPATYIFIVKIQKYNLK